MDPTQRVLIIDGDIESCKQIKYALQSYGIEAYYTQSVVNGIDRIQRYSYELVILDTSLAEQDGLKLLEIMRRMKDMPILVLSSHGDIENKKRAYRLGADDYLQKPYDLADCLLRAQALMRRYHGGTPQEKGQRRYTMVNYEDLFMDPRTREAAHNGKELELTRREFDLLYLLATHEGQVLTHEQLRSHVWGDDFIGDESKAIPTSVSRLRAKLDDGYIETVRGVGYRFKKNQNEKRPGE